jgi:hypothetical protein
MDITKKVKIGIIAVYSELTPVAVLGDDYLLHQRRRRRRSVVEKTNHIPNNDISCLSVDSSPSVSGRGL